MKMVRSAAQRPRPRSSVYTRHRARRVQSMEDENATEETIAAKLEELRRRAALPPGER